MAKSTQIAKAGDASGYPISSEQTLKASKALLSHMHKAAKEAAADASKKNPLEDEEGGSVAEAPVWLALTTKRNIHDSSRLKPARVAVPHPLNKTDPETTICLVVADPQRAYKDLVASDDFPAALRARITRVVDVKHLSAKFRTYEAQRKLASEHDLFLADDRVINRLPKVMGKTFFKTQAKRPIPVVLHKRTEKTGALTAGAGSKKQKRDKDEEGAAKNVRPLAEIVKEIEAAVGAALVHLTPSTSTSVKIGYAGFTPEQIAANAEAVARALVDRHVPKKWDNVRAVYLRGAETASLPIWQTDELWLDAEKDVLAEGSEELKALKEKEEARKTKRIECGKEVANVGKKRKAVAAAEEASVAAEEKPAKKKAKKDKAAAAVESNDDKLDVQIKERKEKLKKLKQAAKLALDD